MKFTIPRDVFFEALQKVQNVVEKKSTVQILSNVLVSVSKNTLSLSATDLEVGVKVSIDAQSGLSVVTEGSVAISAKSIIDIFRELPNKPVLFEKKENHWVKVTCHKSNFNIVGLGAEEFPPLPTFEGKPYLDVSTALIREMIDKTLFSASNDETRYHLNGVYLESIQAGLFRMVSTDGHRLSFIDRELVLKHEENEHLKNGIIIPKKGLVELKRMLDTKSKDSFKLTVEKNSLLVQIDNTSLFIRLIDGEYPDYEQVIPKKNNRNFVVNREEFLASLKRTSLFANEKSKGVKLNISTGVLTLTSSNPDLGEATEEIDIEFNSENTEIGFNARYIIECLTMLDCEKISLSFNDKLSAGVIKVLGREDYTYVVMPMRI